MISGDVLEIQGHWLFMGQQSLAKLLSTKVLVSKVGRLQWSDPRPCALLVALTLRWNVDRPHHSICPQGHHCCWHATMPTATLLLLACCWPLIMCLKNIALGFRSQQTLDAYIPSPLIFLSEQPNTLVPRFPGKIESHLLTWWYCSRSFIVPDEVQVQVLVKAPRQYQLYFHQGDSTAGKVLALQAADLGSIPGIP